MITHTSFNNCLRKGSPNWLNGLPTLAIHRMDSLLRGTRIDSSVSPAEGVGQIVGPVASPYLVCIKDWHT